jgi:transposase-like protein
LPRLPGGFTVNFCRNPHCSHFGDLPDPYDRRGRRPKSSPRLNSQRGIISGSGNERTYICDYCKKSSSVKSNIAILQEFKRINRLNKRLRAPSCANTECKNYFISVKNAPSQYARVGKTQKGDQRYKCKECNKTFSVGLPNRRHKKSHSNKVIFKLLLNFMPMKRIAESADCGISQIYGKLDFFHSQCLKFMTDREKRLPDVLENKNPFISMDAQTIIVNWDSKKRRLSVPIANLVSMHNESQYALFSSSNYDAGVNAWELQEEMIGSGDILKPRSMRDEARIFIPEDYLKCLRGEEPIIEHWITSDYQLPYLGGRVHEDVQYYAHVMMLKKKLGKKWNTLNFCLDRELSLANIINAIFRDGVSSGRVNSAYIAFLKGTTQDEKNRYRAMGKVALALALANLEYTNGSLDLYPYSNDKGACFAKIIEDDFGFTYSPERAEKFRDKGFPDPFHTMTEPAKVIYFQTDRGQFNCENLAEWLSKATMQPLDSYFNRARRRLQGFERGVQTSTNAGKIWHGYSYYRPEMIQK